MKTKVLTLTIVAITVLCLFAGCRGEAPTPTPAPGMPSPFPEPELRHPAEPMLAHSPELVGKAIKIALGDMKVQEQLSGKEYGKEYIISDIMGGTRAINEGILSEEELPYPLAAIVVIHLGRLVEQGTSLLVVVDMSNEEVTLLIHK